MADSPLVASPRQAAVMPKDLLDRIHNAVDERDFPIESFLFIGRKSTGKKTLGLSIPGKRKLILCFDHNAKAGLAGLAGVEYLEFLPKKLKVTLKATPKDGVKGVTSSSPSGPFADFERFHAAALDTGYYLQFDVVGFVSCTSLADIMLDHVVAMQGREGYVAERNDRNLVGQGMANIFRSMLSEKVMTFATAHYSYEQNDETQRMMNIPVLIGQQKSKIPNIFSNVWACEVEDNKGDVKYYIRTVEDKYTMNLGRSRRLTFLKPRHEVTIKDMQHLTREGISIFFNQAGIKAGESQAQSD